MPNNATVNVNVGTLPQAFNPGGSWQTVLNEFFKAVSFYVPGNYNFFNFGNTTPSVENQDRPWIRTNVNGSPDRIYVFFNGNWVSPHPVPASGDERRLWVGTLPNLYSYDGGDGVDPTVTAPTVTTGAMWEEDTDWRDKIPMGVLAATGQVATVGATAGALSQDVTVVEANLPRHRHEVTIESTGVAESTGAAYDQDATGTFKADSGVDFYWDASADRDVVGHTRYYGNATPTAIPVSILPPVRGVYFIKRTARQYYTV